MLGSCCGFYAREPEMRVDSMTSDTSEFDRSVRRQLYDHIIVHGEPPGADQSHLQAGVVLLDGDRDGVEEVGLAEPMLPVDVEGIVGLRRGLGHGLRGCIGEPVLRVDAEVGKGHRPVDGVGRLRGLAPKSTCRVSPTPAEHPECPCASDRRHPGPYGSVSFAWPRAALRTSARPFNHSPEMTYLRAKR